MKSQVKNTQYYFLFVLESFPRKKLFVCLFLWITLPNTHTPFLSVGSENKLVSRLFEINSWQCAFWP